MAKLPDDTALGPVPDQRSGRPIASYDTTAFAKGVARLGEGVSDLGTGVQHYQRAEDDYDYARRASQFETKRIEIDSEFDQDRDFASRAPRYRKSLDDLRAEVLKGASPRVTEQLTLRTDPVVARAVDRQKDIGRRYETDHLVATTQEDGNTLIEASAGLEDRDARVRAIEVHHQRIDALRDRGSITAVQALAMKQQWVQHFAVTDYMKQAERDPEVALDNLRAEPNSREAHVNRILAIEGTGKDPRSSAVGGFINSTWLGLIRKHRPELAQGRSEAEILDMRADGALRRDMAGALYDANIGALKRAGVEPTAGNSYLAHFFGASTAAAVIKAPPGQPISEVLVATVGAAKAQQIMEANPEVLRGRQSGTVVEWAARKMGGDRSQLYRMLPPETRERMIAHGEQALHRRRVDDSAQFKARVTDAIAEAAVTGALKNPIGQWEFVARAGYDQGRRAYESYQADVDLGVDSATMADLSPEQQSALLERYAPVAGVEGYADRFRRFGALSKAREQVEKAKADDPAAFAIKRLPAARAAQAAFQELNQDPTARPEQKQAAARHLADVLLFEQQRVGVPKANRRIVSGAYVELFNDRLANPKAAGGTGNVAAAIEQEAKLWGEHWPLVYRDLAAKGNALAIVLGSGVKPLAAQVLAEHANTKIGDIANDQSDERLNTIKNDVRTAFRPLAATFVGQEGSQPTIDAFQAAGEKLAAWYVRGGKSSPEAAKQAFDDLLGFKYQFVLGGWFGGSATAGDRYRIPKDVRVAPADIARGAEIAKAGLQQFDLQPARATAGTGPDYALRETLQRYGRDAVWVTAPGDTGLMLVYNDQAVRRANGSRLILTWDGLEALAKSDPTTARRERAFERHFRGGTFN